MALIQLLDGCHGQLLAGSVEEGMETLVQGLSRLRSSIPETAWEEYVAAPLQDGINSVGVCGAIVLCPQNHTGPIHEITVVCRKAKEHELLYCRGGGAVTPGGTGVGVG